MKPFLLLAVLLAATSANSETMKTTDKKVTVRLLNSDGTLTEPVETETVVKPDAEWKIRLTEEQFNVTRGHGTERAFCGIFHDNHKEGVYTCIGCGLPLFRSNAKFESGTGWPSFFQPVAKENVETERDTSYGMVREEIHCVRCKSHLGHVFEDGPKPTGLRFCINSASLNFREDGVKLKTEKVMFRAAPSSEAKAAFEKVPGVVATKTGYSGPDKSADEEVVQVEFDPSRVSLDKLLEVFWSSKDPGAIYFTLPEQETAARASVERLKKEGRELVTEIALAGPFFPSAK